MIAEDALLFNETNRLGAALWQRTLATVGLNNDPKMVSCMLFKRLWSHHRGYALLYNGGLPVESDTILRSSIEAAICIAANYKSPDGLWTQLQQDALLTLNGQINQFRDMGDKEMEREAGATRRWLAERLPPGLRAAKLSMQALAKLGEVDMLYRFYRGLSGTSSHVTGLSVMRGVVTDQNLDMQDAWTELTSKSHHLWQIAATLQGSLLHALLLDETNHAQTSIALAKRLNDRLEAAGT